MRPAKIQISLHFPAVRPESSLGAIWIAKDATSLHADKEDSDQTARMRRLIWVFIGRTCNKIHNTKTSLCNFDPLIPHFYIVKLGFTGVYIIFLISAQNIDCESR